MPVVSLGEAWSCSFSCGNHDGGMDGWIEANGRRRMSSEGWMKGEIENDDEGGEEEGEEGDQVCLFSLQDFIMRLICQAPSTCSSIQPPHFFQSHPPLG